MSIPGLLDANGWLQKVLETVRLAGDALPLFSPQPTILENDENAGVLTRIAHNCIHLFFTQLRVFQMHLWKVFMKFKIE